jgi:DNA-binding CsgD family transcriptional regulator
MTPCRARSRCGASGLERTSRRFPLFRCVTQRTRLCCRMAVPRCRLKIGPSGGGCSSRIRTLAMSQKRASQPFGSPTWSICGSSSVTEIYQVCLQPIGATYQAALRLSRRPDSFTLISVWRADRDFGERELEPALVFARALRAAWGLRLVLSQLASEASAVDVTTDPPLTARQAEVVSLVAQGLTNQQIAVRLQVTPRTVRKHVEDLFRRTGARSRTELAVRWTTAQCGISGSPRQNSISL